MDNGGGGDSPGRVRGSEGRFIKERQLSRERDDDGASFKEQRPGLPRRRLQDAASLEDNEIPDPAPHRAVKRGRWSGADKVDNGDSTQGVDPEYVPRSGYFFEHDHRAGPPQQRSTGRWHGQYRDYPPPQEYGGREGKELHGNSRKPSGRWEHDRFSEAARDHPRGRYSRGVDGDRNDGALDDRWGSTERKREGGRNNPRDEGHIRHREHGRRGPIVETGEKRETSPGRQAAERTWRREEERYGPSPWMDDKPGSDPSARDRGWRNERRGWENRLPVGEAGPSRQDRWEHDLFEEVNKSPSPHKDKDPNATDVIEALLAA